MHVLFLCSLNAFEQEQARIRAQGEPFIMLLSHQYGTFEREAWNKRHNVTQIKHYAPVNCILICFTVDYIFFSFCRLWQKSAPYVFFASFFPWWIHLNVVFHSFIIFNEIIKTIFKWAFIIFWVANSREKWKIVFNQIATNYLVWNEIRDGWMICPKNMVHFVAPCHFHRFFFFAVILCFVYSDQ